MFASQNLPVVLQAIRAFVESVLRYGLPVNFLAALFKVRCTQPGRVPMLTPDFTFVAAQKQGEENPRKAPGYLFTRAGCKVAW